MVGLNVTVETEEITLKKRKKYGHKFRLDELKKDISDC